MDNTQTHGKYISWPILTLMAFVTVIGFDDIMYNFKNQGMTVYGLTLFSNGRATRFGLQ